MTLMAER